MMHELKAVDEVEIPHTPGPWVVREGFAFPFWVDAPDSRRGICVVDKQGYDVDTANSHTRGNGNLIAAAPDMLKALEEVYKNWDGEPEDMIPVQAAIKSARGQK